MLSAVREIWEKVDVKNGIKTALAALVSFYLCLWLNGVISRPDILKSVLWGVIASVVVLQSSLGSTYLAIWNRILGVLIGSLIGAATAYFLGGNVLVLAFAIFITIAICSIFNLQESYRIACLSVAVVIIPWSLHTDLSPWVFAFFRFLDTCTGVLVAAIVAHLVWPAKALDGLRQDQTKTLDDLSKYYQDIFCTQDAAIRKDQDIQSRIFEINQAISGAYSILEESKVERSHSAAVIGIWADIIDCLEAIFESLNALNRVFSRELQALFDEELKLQMKKIVAEIPSIFDDTIKRFQINEKVDIAYLTDAKAELNAQMIRFRETKITRQYGLQIIESYFVFFYSFKSLIKEFIRLHRLMDSLESSP